MGTGFAFGLFAVFSMLRYRADTIDIKEMTFLFVCTVMAVINSLVTRNVPIYMILTVNVFIVLASYILEKSWLDKAKGILFLTYENVELIHTGKREELRRDLEMRTGLAIHGIDVESINYLNDSAKLRICYEQNGGAPAPYARDSSL